MWATGIGAEKSSKEGLRKGHNSSYTDRVALEDGVVDLRIGTSADIKSSALVVACGMWPAGTSSKIRKFLCPNLLNIPASRLHLR
jgi:hypothetical protein